MLFSRSFLIALVSAPFLALAQTNSTGSGMPNPPTNTNDQFTGISAGQPFTLSWTPTTGGTVSIVLRDGAASNLNVGTVIQRGIDNSGSYTFTVPADTVRGSQYTFEIVDDQDPEQVNYTRQFVIDSSITVASSSLFSSVSLAAITSGATLASSATASPSAFPLQSGLTLVGTSVYATISATTGTGSMSTSSGASMTGTSTSSSAASSGMTTHASSSTQAGLVAGQSSTSTHSGSAHRATAMAGMLGVVALGALAL